MNAKDIRILVVDDEEPIRNVCEKFLTRFGYKIELAENGQDALQSVIHNDFDLVLTDFNMPDLDGMELVKRIRESKPHVSVIMMTGFGTIELAVDVMKKGADDFVVKPFNFEHVQLTIERVLKNREMDQEVRKLRNINRKLEELDKIKDKFIDITSHELKTPVTNILTFSELLGESSNAISQDQQEFLSIINTSAQKLGRIVEDMHLSLIDTELKSHLCFDPVDLKDLIHNLLDEFKNVANNRSLTISSNFSENLCEWNGDEFQLQRAIRELLCNAIKFTPDGGKIQIDSTLVGDDLELKVIDNGIGISDDDQFKIFDKFYEAQNTEYHSTSETGFMGSGTGLGLCVVKSIIDAHDGKILVQSQLNEGSTFTIKLPKLLPKVIESFSSNQ